MNTTPASGTTLQLCADCPPKADARPPHATMHSLPLRHAPRYSFGMYCLFVDLDGVLVDFDSGVRSATGKWPHEQSPRSMWLRLAQTPDFYESLEWIDEGRRLWEGVRDLHPTILTGLPLGRWAEPQKRSWCRRELGEEVPVITCMSREKHSRARQATPEGAVPVLIDDRRSLEERFTEAGGIFIHHATTDETLRQLDALDGPFLSAVR